MNNGILIVNKEKNMTSRDVVNSLVSFFHTKKIGHTGTLDPLATGVLVCCINDATKLVEMLTSTEKEYIATMKLGIKTDTYDITGKILDTHEVNISERQIIDALSHFKGIYNQEVPIYSSVKVNGQKLYSYARNNQSVALPVREVNIKVLELIGIKDNEVTFKCLVSKGTYIRSLINDLGTYLGCYATMTELTRTKQGKFEIEDSYSLEQIKNNEYKLLSIDEVLDYKIYPIADNKKPKLSADRFEYSVSTRLIWDKTFSLSDIRYIWSDITVLENEDGIIEMGFNHVKNAEKLVETACYTAKSFQLNENKLSLQFLADLLKKMIEKKLVTYDELYTIDEAELINRITNSNETKIKEIWEYYTKMDSVLRSDEIVPGKYCIGFKVKGRFINPLVKVQEGIKRIYDVSMNSKTLIDVLMNYKDTPYAYIEFSMDEEKSED